MVLVAMLKNPGSWSHLRFLFKCTAVVLNVDRAGVARGGCPYRGKGWDR